MISIYAPVFASLIFKSWRVLLTVFMIMSSAGFVNSAKYPGGDASRLATGDPGPLTTCSCHYYYYSCSAMESVKCKPGQKSPNSSVLGHGLHRYKHWIVSPSKVQTLLLVTAHTAVTIKHNFPFWSRAGSSKTN